MVIVTEGFGGDLGALKLGYLDRSAIVATLRYDICDDIEFFIKVNIPPVNWIADKVLSFGLFVFEPERSTLIKLTYH